MRVGTPATHHAVRIARQRARRGTRAEAFLHCEFGITGATLTLVIAFFGSAVLGAARQVLFNARFGTGPEASAYYAAFRLPDTLFAVAAGGALSSAFIPIVLSARHRQGEAAAERLTHLVLSTLLAVVLLAVLLGQVFAGPFVDHVLVPGFEAETRALTVRLTRIMLLQPLILAVGTVFAAVLNSHRRFVLTGLSVAAHNIALLGGIAVAYAVPEIGVYGPAVGVVAGAALQVAILWPGLTRLRLRLRPAWDLTDARLREVGRLFAPNALAFGVGYLAFIVDTAFASRAREPAALPALQNAWLLTALPVRLLGQAAAQASFPALAAQAAVHDYTALRRTALRTAAVLAVLGVAACAGLALLGRPVVRVLFEHGRFTAADGDLTTRLLLIFALGLPSYLATEVLVRALIAARCPQAQLATNTGQLLLRVALMAALLDRLGVVAISLAHLLSCAVETVVLLVWTRRRTRRLSRIHHAGG